MGIFDRLSTLLRSNINDLISRAEDPEKMLSPDPGGHADAAREVQAAGRLRDRGRESVFAIQADAEYRQAADWEEKAMLAWSRKAATISPSRRSSVQEREHQSHGVQLEQTWESHRLETDKLKNSLRDLNDKIEDAKRKKNLLIARQRRAQAQMRIAETWSSLSEKSAFDAFARMEERIEQSERQTLKASIGARRRVDGRHARERLQGIGEEAPRPAPSTISSWRSSRRWECCPPALRRRTGSLGPDSGDEGSCKGEIEGSSASDKKSR